MSPGKNIGIGCLALIAALAVAPAPSRAETRETTAADRAVVSSLRAAITRQIKPHWHAPDGRDGEKLVTILRFELDREGNLIGVPQTVTVQGVTDKNRRLVEKHVRNAQKAVQKAAPFKLPPEHYDYWKRATFRFDRRPSE
jgi:hypothetical protein